MIPVKSFAQGEVVSSFENTHMALYGKGFFVVSSSPGTDGEVF